tara:strand:- start:565 stop:1638 length:1074 start_codon:yes stop_codon:yes gene_type:complete
MKKKSLSVKKIIPRRFNLNKILKDKKIFGIYTKFAKDFENFNDSNKIAISVSGGADSMALCFLVYCYKIRKNNKIKPFFYLIDHGLRTNSKQEAETVKKQLKLKKINLNVLKWKGKKPRSNIQSLARKKRYEILFNECKKLKIQTILTAHHQDDVYETFFSRLLRGSGTEGLSSFVNFKKNLLFEGNSIIKIVRPLLSFSKQELTYLTDVVFNFYINDPSNEMEKFQRVRLRKLISNLKNEGLDFGKLRLSLNNLASTNKAINQIVHNNILENTFFDKKKYIIKSDFFLFPDEIVFRSLSYIIKKISKKYYPPRGKKMVNLILDLKNKEHFKATLGGTIIEKIHNSVVVSEEKTKKR